MNIKEIISNKKRLIVIISVIAVIIISEAVIILALNSGKSNDDKKQSETSSAGAGSAASEDSTADTTLKLPDAPPTSEVPVETEEPDTMPTIDIYIPTEGGEVTHFDGVYVPDSVAEDVATGEKVSMRSLFGKDYASGAITFYSNGTFKDTISASGMESGAYNAENRKIKATYLPDRQMNITVIEWDDASSKPFSFYIIYNFSGVAEYKVNFSEKK